MTFTTQNIINGIMLCFVLIGAIAAWSNSKSAKRSNDENDTLTTIKIKDLTIETLQKENKELNDKFIKQGERIAVLEAANAKLEAIVQNRNPELENFMKSTSASLLIIERSIEALLKSGTGVTINQTK